MNTTKNKTKSKVVKLEEEKKKKYNIKNQNSMKIVNEIIKREAKRKAERKGLWRTKTQNQDIKYTKYCKENNATKTYGGWKNKVYGVAKSNIQRRIENEELKPDWYENKLKPVKIKTREAVILHDKDTNKYDAYEADVEKINGEIIIKIICGRKKINVKAHYEPIEDEDIIKIALQNKASIYIIDEIISK